MTTLNFNSLSIPARQAAHWVLAPVPGIRDTDKEKQRGEFHTHIAKQVYLDTHNPAVITIDEQDR